MTFAAIGGAAGSALVSGGINKLFGGAQGGQQGFDLVNNPFLGELGQGQNFLLDQLRGVNQGQVPQFFQNQIPQLRGALDSGLRNTFFGQPGRRGEGLVSQAVSLGSLTGAGPRSAVSQGNKQLQNFGLQSQAIDQFIAQQGVDITRETALNAPRSLASIASAANPQAIPFNQAPSGGLNIGDDFLSGVGGGITSLLNKGGTALGGLFGGGGGGGGIGGGGGLASALPGGGLSSLLGQQTSQFSSGSSRQFQPLSGSVA